MAEETGVTEEQALGALRELAGHDDPDSGIPQPETLAPEPSVEEPIEPEVAAPVEEAVAEDDLESLKSRNDELIAKQEEFEARIQATQARNQENERVLRDRFLRKSTVLDRATQLLKSARTEEGVSEVDVDRLIADIGGTMHPSSASYVPPPVQQPIEETEDKTMLFNSFFNAKGMTDNQAEEFVNWIKTDAGTAMSPEEHDVANDSIPGFLQLAHIRMKEQKAQKTGKRDDAVEAVKSVQRTQRQAAKAASGTPSSATKQQPTGSATEIDVSKLTHGDISTLLKQSVNDYK